MACRCSPPCHPSSANKTPSSQGTINPTPYTFNPLPRTPAIIIKHCQVCGTCTPLLPHTQPHVTHAFKLQPHMSHMSHMRTQIPPVATSSPHPTTNAYTNTSKVGHTYYRHAPYTHRHRHRHTAPTTCLRLHSPDMPPPPRACT